MKKKRVLFGVIIAQIIIAYFSAHYAAQLHGIQFGGIPAGVTLLYFKLAKWFIMFPLLSFGLTVVSLRKGDLERQYDKIIILSFVAIFLTSLLTIIGIGQLFALALI